MKALYLTLITVMFMSACATKGHNIPVDEATMREAADQQLTAWHEAASRASEVDYLDHGMTPDGVFLGTDPEERWPREAFRAYAKPHFAKGKGWTMKATRRWMSFNDTFDTAWFDEDLESSSLGPSRGSGVMVWKEGRWKVAQYNLSVPIPNDDFNAVRKLIEKRAKKRKK